MRPCFPINPGGEAGSGFLVPLDYASFERFDRVRSRVMPVENLLVVQTPTAPHRRHNATDGRSLHRGATLRRPCR
jgi:hypothetical protein